MQMKGPLGDWSDGKTVLGMEWLFGNLVIDGCAAFRMQMKGPLVDWSDGRAVFGKDSWVAKLSQPELLCAMREPCP